MATNQQRQDVRFEKTAGWTRKFRLAMLGALYAIRTQSSFLVHLPCAALVVAMGCVLPVDRMSFLVLLACVAAVLAAEMFNTSIEFLAKSITDRQDENIRIALDVASGAVLLVSLFAAAIGVLVLLPAVVDWLGWGEAVR